MKTLESLKAYSKERDKDVWGPVFWDVLHTQAKDNQLTPSWLDAFTRAIPCIECKRHFKENRKNYPLSIAKDHLLWTWLIHNVVNTERSNRPFFSLNEFKKRYK